jgi:hypothetical protein
MPHFMIVGKKFPFPRMNLLTGLTWWATLKMLIDDGWKLLDFRKPHQLI